MGHITLEMTDEAVTRLQKDFEAFVRISTKLDRLFAIPRVEDYLSARIVDNALPLTEDAVQKMLEDGQYAWAKRTTGRESPEQQFANAIGAAMRRASDYGFDFAYRAEWTPEELIRQCHGWASQIAAEAGGAEALIDPLAIQLKKAVQNIRSVEEVVQTPAWQLASQLRQAANAATIACEANRGSAAREKLGELRGLLRLGVTYGQFDVQEARQTMQYLRLRKPEIFVDEPDDIFSRLGNWLRSLLTGPVRFRRDTD